ncbi:MAG: dipeptide/oligopeptide/nickel ABC transporter ATP-binding protein [Treponema sp.]|jgi:peptide/nickel transport system ATP-binding protein|nr:dipeptide/oligopeptide/nickel ABC transporter ATP-binding protein [Treponema sp.]
MTALLSVRGLCASYESRSLGFAGRRVARQVLRDFNLEMAQGEILGIMGPSGCGKTTLARCILGLMPFEGRIVIDGLAQDGKHRPAMARKVGAVFQEPGGSLNPRMRIGRILEEPLRGLPRAEREALARETLGMVGLDPDLAGRFPAELSAGQKQRAAIASALTLRPRLLTADEALSSLDLSAAAQLASLFQDLRQRLGIGILFITHDPDLAACLCDRVITLG